MYYDLRHAILNNIRLHPRVAYQGLFDLETQADAFIASLPSMPSFRNPYHAAITILDWDHKLPSQKLKVHLYAFYSETTYQAGLESFDDRLEVIGAKDQYPEFDVPDFGDLFADEAYQAELSIDGKLGDCVLTSAWRRDIEPEETSQAISLIKDTPEYKELIKSQINRPVHFGGLEPVSWTPPCETSYAKWTLDIWYLLAFDGRVGSGKSFLVDLDKGELIQYREFSVQTG